MNVVIIGSGNVAQILARMIVKTRHQLAGIVCRNPENLLSAPISPGTSRFLSFADKPPEADIYIAAVSDRFLPELHQHFKPQVGIIVHTAGSVPVNVLKQFKIPFGVLYPLQTLRRETLLIPEVPFLVDGSDEDTIKLIEGFARDLSEKVTKAGDDIRKKFHLAAVYSANFINYLIIQTFQYCKAENLDTGVLLPVLNETIKRLSDFAPSDVQTGPAMRDDQPTIDVHLKMLEDYPEMRRFYGIFTTSIKNYYQHSGKSG